MLQGIFLLTFNLFNTDFIFVLQGSKIRILKKKKKNPKRIMYSYRFNNGNLSLQM